MFTATLLAIVSLCFLVFSIYGAFYCAVILSFLRTRARPPQNSEEKHSCVDYGPVSVLLASYNEGPALSDTVETLLNQDYSGSIDINVLIKDGEDSSFDEVNQRFPLDNQNEFKRGNRLLRVVFTGLQPKKDKLNYALERDLGDFVAILDADHRAHPRWISSSLPIMHAKNADAVQGVRAALDTRQIFKFWDSAENHLGNEVLNTTFAKWGLSGFFTGTTCIFKAGVLREAGFPDSITEDTYLSYSLILKGSKIAYNGEYGSYEEVSPDLKTYVNRRRRWSCGHNQTYFNHLKTIFSSRLPLASKIQLFFHGAYFLIPTAIVLDLNCFGLFYFFQFTENVQVFSLLAATSLALVLNPLVSNTARQYLQNFGFTFLWIFPQVTIASIFVYKFSSDELYFQIISFPFFGESAWIHLTLILLPVILLVTGSVRLARPSFGHFLLFLPTFPIILFLDIYALYMGFIDHLLRRSDWGRINRSYSIDARGLPGGVVNSLRSGQRSKPQYWTYSSFLVAFISAILAHDLLVFDNCGHPDYIFGKPFIYEKTFNTKLDVQISKARSEVEGQVKITAVVNLSNPDKRELSIKSGFSEHPEELKKLGGQDIRFEQSYTTPFGFEENSFHAEVQGGNKMCFLEVPFSTKLVEILKGKLHLNAEPFLIKGIIPSFRTANIDLGIEEGLEQIKNTGANSIRMYHTPTDETLRLAEKLHLLVISQPDETTWQNINMDEFNSDKDLVSRYRDHVSRTSHSTFLLFDHLGNELEVPGSESRSISNIKSALEKSRSSSHFRYPLSYSTYKVYEKFPVDILGVNMLDTGSTYWDKGLDLIRNNNQAFYASEFGGFVAFFETTSPLVRARRVTDYWNRILQAGGSGAMFFQSHDNWAQPVFSGYNDPFNPEQPDDLRGLWDHRNQQKYILKHLINLYSDFDAVINNGQLELTNRRNHKISNLKVDDQHLADLEPLQGIKIPVIDTIAPTVEYTTHSGLKHRYQLPISSHNDGPVFENEFVDVEENNGVYSGSLAGSDILQFSLPSSWKGYKINQKVFNNDERNRYRFTQPGRAEFQHIEWRTPGSGWTRFNQIISEGGQHEIRVKLPTGMPLEDYSIVLDGTGSQALTFHKAGQPDFRLVVHNYREQRIPLKDVISYIDDGWLSFGMNRQAIGFIHPRYTSDGKMISIDLQRPYLEKWHHFELSRHDQNPWGL